MTLVPPYDHPHVIAGQGTVGLEIAADVAAAAVLVPVGGGGLASGVATAVKALSPGTRVIGVEPELAADAAESLAAGRHVTWPVEQTGRTVADGLRTTLSELTYAHLAARLDGIVTVTEEEILSTVGSLARDYRVVAEPSGAVAPAAWLHHASSLRQRFNLGEGPVVAVVSGGNVDPSVLAAAL
jgi:threonine dehydratase